MTDWKAWAPEDFPDPLSRPLPKIWFTPAANGLVFCGTTGNAAQNRPATMNAYELGAFRQLIAQMQAVLAEAELLEPYAVHPSNDTPKGEDSE